MKFTVPAAENAEQAERVWEATRKFLEQQGCPTEDRRIARIAFRHNAKPYDLSVGDIHPDLREPVLVIFEAANPQLYYICTPNRGVIRGEPYLVGNGVETRAFDFEPA